MTIQCKCGSKQFYYEETNIYQFDENLKLTKEDSTSARWLCCSICGSDIAEVEDLVLAGKTAGYGHEDDVVSIIVDDPTESAIILED